MKKSIPRKTPKEAVSENPVPAVAITGFEDFWKDGSEPMTLSEKELCSQDANGCIFSTAGRPKS